MPEPKDVERYEISDRACQQLVSIQQVNAVDRSVISEPRRLLLAHSLAGGVETPEVGKV